MVLNPLFGNVIFPIFLVYYLTMVALFPLGIGVIVLEAVIPWFILLPKESRWHFKSFLPFLGTSILINFISGIVGVILGFVFSMGSGFALRYAYSRSPIEGLLWWAVACTFALVISLLIELPIGGFALRLMLKKAMFGKPLIRSLVFANICSHLLIMVLIPVVGIIGTLFNPS